MALRNYSNTAVPCVIASGGINATQTSIPIVGSTGAGYPATPFILGIDRGNSSQEVCLCTSIIDSTHFGVVRGYDGSPNVSHLAGATVEHTAAAIDYREPNAFINTLATLGDILVGSGGVGNYGLLSVPTGTSQYPGWPNGLQLVVDNTQSLGIAWEQPIPAGAILFVANATVPTGYLAANGQSANKTTYAGLFGAIGYSYGGSGANFNVPDIRSRVVVGAGTGSGLSLRTLATTGGEENHVLVIGETPSHSHTGGGTTGGQTADHTHAFPVTLIQTNAPSSVGVVINPNIQTLGIEGLVTGGASNDHGHGYSFTTSAVGGNGGHNNMQPWIALTALIKC